MEGRWNYGKLEQTIGMEAGMQSVSHPLCI